MTTAKTKAKEALEAGSTTKSGWKTSEGQLTAAVAALYALGQAAEALGAMPAGTVEKLWPLTAMVGGYVMNRTWLKIKGLGGTQ